MAIKKGKMNRKPKSGLVRNSFRIPGDNAVAGSLSIKGQEYEVVNVNRRGIGVRFTEPDSFSDGEEFAMRLVLHETPFDLHGRVVHVSPDSITANYLCGIELIKIDKKTVKQLEACIQQDRANLFHK